MPNTQNALTIPIPEMHRYRTADHRVKASFFLFWILSTSTILSAEEFPDPPIYIAMCINLLLTAGLLVHRQRVHKRLSPIINRTFTEQFTAHTGLQYPHVSNILKSEGTVFALSRQSTPLAWDVKTTKHGFTVMRLSAVDDNEDGPGGGSDRDIADDVRYWV